jgi:hypothetical protein
MKTGRWLFLFVLNVALPAWSADPPKAPVPPSPYIGVVYRYADTMLAKGRDTVGPQKTGLFLSALDRTALAPLTSRPQAPAGVREADRAGDPLTGANAQHDENLLRLLYTLSELSSKPIYRDAADAELKWSLTGTAQPGLFVAWDAVKDEVIKNEGGSALEVFRPWMLWDRCFDLAPDPSKQLASVNPGDKLDSPREAGFCVRKWAVGYARTKDGQFLRAIEGLLERFEKQRPASFASSLSMAIDFDGAALRLVEPLASRLRTFAAREDEAFCALPHDLKQKGGFASPAGLTSQWEEKEGARTTAAVALMCLARYENTGSTAYRDLLTAAAESYLNSPPPENLDLWPLTLGHAISLQVAAWRHTARPAHLEHARRLADFAVEKFWGISPLPRASLKSEHYESLTGAGTLALALAELHLNILHITAVRCPPNTIDR